MHSSHVRWRFPAHKHPKSMPIGGEPDATMAQMDRASAFPSLGPRLRILLGSFLTIPYKVSRLETAPPWGLGASQCAPLALDSLTPQGISHSILRIRLLSESATYTLPSVSTATPEGLLNCADVPMPSLKPTVLPARVLTKPSAVILRIR